MALLHLPKNITTYRYKRFGYIEALVLLPIIFKIILAFIFHLSTNLELVYLPLYIFSIYINSLRFKQILLLTQIAATIYTLTIEFRQLDINAISYILGYVFLIIVTFAVVSQQYSKETS